MKATKQSHDWHCHIHDTYGWRGEECKQCKVAPSEVGQLVFRNERLVADYASLQEENNTLRRIHAENLVIKDAEIARLKNVPMKYRRMEFNAQLQAENAALQERVVTLEKLQDVALLESLRAEVERLKSVNRINIPTDTMEQWASSEIKIATNKLRQQLAIAQLEAKRLREAIDSAINGLRWWMDAFPLHVTEADNEEMLKLVKTISSPTSTEALDAYVAEKVKEAESRWQRAFDEGMRFQRKCVELTRQRDLAVSALKQSREALRLPCDRWNKTQFEIVQSAIASIDSAIKESEA